MAGFVLLLGGAIPSWTIRALALRQMVLSLRCRRLDPFEVGYDRLAKVYIPKTVGGGRVSSASSSLPAIWEGVRRRSFCSLCKTSSSTCPPVSSSVCGDGDGVVVWINDTIPFDVVRIGSLPEPVSLDRALAVARAHHLELVLYDPQQSPPLCLLLTPPQLLDFLQHHQTDQTMKPTSGTTTTIDGEGYSFDPSSRVMGVAISAVTAEADFLRQITKARKGLKNGSRLDVLIPRGRATLDGVASHIERICGELADLGIPINPPQRTSELNCPATVLKLYPCTPEQANRFAQRRTGGTPKVLADHPPDADVDLENAQDRDARKAKYHQHLTNRSRYRKLRQKLYATREKDGNDEQPAKTAHALHKNLAHMFHRE